ncbi:MAG: DinB family protein [Ignavibacterium sp.]|nr:MAG: DinB family protein [Ignavibacterium sp.]
MKKQKRREKERNFRGILLNITYQFDYNTNINSLGGKMFKSLSVIFLVFLATLLLVALNSDSKAVPQKQPVFVQEFIGQMSFIEGRLLELEGAIPQELMGWEPADLVRNTAQVFLHVADANYFLLTFITGEKMEGEFGAIEKSTTDKEEIAKIIKKSFTTIKEAISKLTEDDLNKMVKTPFGELSIRSFMISILNHNHEHLGQAIAYGRMNGITPPWSAKQDSKTETEG